jgi:signal transduction histidine kinase
MQSGLGVIAARAGSLERFLQGYARLARLPPPQFAACDLGALLRQAAALERRLPVEVGAGAPLRLQLDGAQIEQAIINLLKNAVDAALEQKAPHVRISWRAAGDVAEIAIEDNGAGIADTSNLFVPFFTTKAEGSGIGLVLSQQIAENHDGALSLYNRDDRSGCIAIIRLPLPKGG